MVLSARVSLSFLLERTGKLDEDFRHIRTIPGFLDLYLEKGWIRIRMLNKESDPDPV